MVFLYELERVKEDKYYDKNNNSECNFDALDLVAAVTFFPKIQKKIWDPPLIIFSSDFWFA